jgi:N-acetylglucosaminyldiphosphoundecaprenol N-acetyl-beta-D-mannosaminyltransferase
MNHQSLDIPMDSTLDQASLSATGIGCVSPAATTTRLHCGLEWVQRPVHHLLGLPFDAVSMTQALEAVRLAINSRQRLFISTANVNFAMAAGRDQSFRNSVLASDLVLVDGMPLVWLARLQGLPFRERIAGADLFEQLLRQPGPTIKVYFFGGPSGAAEAAARKVNTHQGALHCVGWASPGFGGVADMSTTTQINAINSSGADFIVVSLGALKGQAWIMHNRDRLHAPVISHLGAVVNFMAGSVQRAPHWMQRCGLEWLWRIAKEPALWLRYWNDGVELLVSIKQIAVDSVCQRAKRLIAARHRDSNWAIELTSHIIDGAARWRIHVSGTPGMQRTTALRTALAQVANCSISRLQVVLSKTTYLSNQELALLQLAQWHLSHLVFIPASSVQGNRMSRLGFRIEHSECVL